MFIEEDLLIAFGGDIIELKKMNCFLKIREFLPIITRYEKERLNLRISRQKTGSLSRADFEIQLKLFQHIAERMRFNSILLNSLPYDDAAGRLLTILNFVKDSPDKHEQYCCKIPYTRKDIASLTGLRIETVIRIFKKMEHAGILKIIKGKNFY